MALHFGWKAALAVIVNALMVTVLFSRELSRQPELPAEKSPESPWWLKSIHLVFMAVVVWMSHHAVVFLGILLVFAIFVSLTKSRQDGLKIKEGLSVGFFLAGLVVLGGFQRWWLEPLFARLSEAQIFLGAAVLTAVNDNAALTYLGTQIPGLSEAFQYALVAGAVTGGGLTVIANAPNPAGFAILKDHFGAKGISALGLLFWALPPTLIALLAFWFLPSPG